MELPDLDPVRLKIHPDGSLGIHHFFSFYFGVGIKKIDLLLKKKRGCRFGEFREFRWLHAVVICFRKILSQQVPFSLTMHQVIFKRWHATSSISQVCEFLFFKDPHRKFGTKKRHRARQRSSDENMARWG